MAEQVDAADLKSAVRKDMPVRFGLGPPPLIRPPTLVTERLAFG